MNDAFEVRVEACGRYYCEPDWRWDTGGGLSDYDMLTFHGGRGHYITPGGTFDVGSGHCLTLRKGDRIRASLDPSDPMIVTFIRYEYVDGRDREIVPRSEWLPALFRVLEDPPFFYSLVGKVVEHSGGRPAGQTADAWMKVALLELLDQDSRPRWSGEDREQAEAVEAVCGEIRRQPARRLKVAELARRFHCSPDHFTRIFRKYGKLSPEAFMISARIDAAMTYLRTSSHSIGRIAELLGYSDVYAFSRQFRQKTGRTPSAFRREAGVP